MQNVENAGKMCTEYNNYGSFVKKNQHSGLPIAKYSQKMYDISRN
jgi:hypothetical protein